MSGPPVILPPFDEESARRKVQVAQDAWNTRDPDRVALAYTEDSRWRNRDEFFQGRDAIREFLRRKWARELDYRLRKELWCYQGNRISVRFEYESHDAVASGGAATATSTGSSTRRPGSCAVATRASTTTGSTPASGGSRPTSGASSMPASAATTRAWVSGSRTVRRRWSAVRPGNEAHGRTAMPCARRRCGRRAALRQVDEDEVRRAGVDGGAGQPAQALGEVGAQRAVSCATSARMVGAGGDGLDGGERERVDRPARTLGAQPRRQGHRRQEVAGAQAGDGVELGQAAHDDEAGKLALGCQRLGLARDEVHERLVHDRDAARAAERGERGARVQDARGVGRVAEDDEVGVLGDLVGGERPRLVEGDVARRRGRAARSATSGSVNDGCTQTGRRGASAAASQKAWLAPLSSTTSFAPRPWRSATAATAAASSG